MIVEEEIKEPNNQGNGRIVCTYLEIIKNYHRMVRATESEELKVSKE